jgi:hypothetical protein
MRKKTSKKIVLAKETLRALDDRAVYRVAGGISLGGTGTGGGFTCQASCATDRTCVNCDTTTNC